MTQEGFRDPYSSQNRRAAQIAERYAATYTPETLPEHLRPAMEAAEAHFAKTAPGKQTSTPTVEVEAPPQDAIPEPPEMYFDPTTGEEHEIDQDRTAQEAAGETAVAATNPEIPEDVQAELKAFRDRHPSAHRPTDERHITVAYVRGRGAL